VAKKFVKLYPAKSKKIIAALNEYFRYYRHRLHYFY